MQKTYRGEILLMVLNHYGTEPEYPFASSPDSAVLRHPNQKWYGLIMNIPRCKLGLSGEGDVDILNVKCDPAFSGTVRLHPGIFPGYHMNKENWLSILLDGTVDLEEIEILLDMSYKLVRPKRKIRRQKRELDDTKTI